MNEFNKKRACLVANFAVIRAERSEKRRRQFLDWLHVVLHTPQEAQGDVHRAGIKVSESFIKNVQLKIRLGSFFLDNQKRRTKLRATDLR